MLRMIGFGENIGSGFPKILLAWKEAGWPMPELTSDHTLNETQLRLPVPRMAQNGAENRPDIGQTSVRNLSEVNPSGTDVAQNGTGNGTDAEMAQAVFSGLLDVIRENPHVTRRQLAAILNKSERTVARFLSKLKEVGLIERIGGDRGGFWKVN